MTPPPGRNHCGQPTALRAGVLLAVAVPLTAAIAGLATVPTGR